MFTFHKNTRAKALVAVAVFFSATTAQLSAQSNRFDWNDWVAGSTSHTNRVGTCTMTTNVTGGVEFVNSSNSSTAPTAPYYTTAIGAGLHLRHNWSSTSPTSPTVVTITFSRAITDPTFTIRDINANGANAACSNLWADQVSIAGMNATTPITPSITPADPSEVSVTDNGNAKVITGLEGSTAGLVDISFAGTITQIVIEYTSLGGTLSSSVGCIAGSTNPTTQFITIESIGGSTCCLNAPIAVRHNPAGAQCSGTQLNFSSSPVGNNGSLSYNWEDLNTGLTGNSNTFSTTPINTANVNITPTINIWVESNVVTGANQGATTCATSFSPIIKPIPTVNAVADQLFCGGAATQIVPFSGNGVSGTIYSWANNNTTIGLSAATGTGDIPSFTGEDAGGFNAASITVTPTANGCVGAPQTFAYLIEACAALPIELLSFTVKNKDYEALLEWKTATEINNQYFIIEYSTDGVSFKEIGKTPSLAVNGNSNTPLSYSFLTKNLIRGLNYYRLKQIDRDGSFSYSSVEKLDLSLLDKNILAYPNPTNGVVQIALNNPTNTAIEARIFNSIGQQISNSTAITTAMFEVDLTAYPVGVYFIEILKDNITNRIKIVHQ